MQVHNLLTNNVQICVTPTFQLAARPNNPNLRPNHLTPPEPHLLQTYAQSMDGPERSSYTFARAGAR